MGKCRVIIYQNFCFIASYLDFFCTGPVQLKKIFMHKPKTVCFCENAHARVEWHVNVRKHDLVQPVLV